MGEEKEASTSKQTFEPGQIYFKPRKPPGRAPKGYHWIAAEGPVEEGSPIGWTLQAFEPGQPYYSPHKPPGEEPEGYHWIVARRHEQKGYPIDWTLQSTNPEPPDMNTLSPIGPHGEEMGDSQIPLPEPKKD